LSPPPATSTATPPTPAASVEPGVGQLRIAGLVVAFAERLRQVGFMETERRRRPGVGQPGHRPHAAIAS
jgi:hypothetical protein